MRSTAMKGLPGKWNRNMREAGIINKRVRLISAHAAKGLLTTQHADTCGKCGNDRRAAGSAAHLAKIHLQAIKELNLITVYNVAGRVIDADERSCLLTQLCGPQRISNSLQKRAEHAFGIAGVRKPAIPVQQFRDAADARANSRQSQRHGLQQRPRSSFGKRVQYKRIGSCAKLAGVTLFAQKCDCICESIGK